MALSFALEVCKRYRFALYKYFIAIIIIKTLGVKSCQQHSETAFCKGLRTERKVKSLEEKNYQVFDNPLLLCLAMWAKNRVRFQGALRHPIGSL